LGRADHFAAGLKCNIGMLREPLQLLPGVQVRVLPSQAGRQGTMLWPFGRQRCHAVCHATPYAMPSPALRVQHAFACWGQA
jgi:hypothetical protein